MIIKSEGEYKYINANHYNVKITRFILVVLSASAAALFLLATIVLLYKDSVVNADMISSYSMLSSLALIFTAFFVTVKKGSYITASVLIAIAIFQVYTGYNNLMILQNPAFIGSGEFAENNSISIIISLVMIGMAILTIGRKRKSASGTLEKKLEGKI